MSLKLFLYAYSILLHEFPCRMKMITAAIITFIADYIAQCIEKSMNTGFKLNKLIAYTLLKLESLCSWSFLRGLRMIIWGCINGCIAHFWFTGLDIYFGEISTKNTVIKLILDQTLYATFMNAFYLLYIAMLTGQSCDIRQQLKETMIVNWAFWPIVQIINFCFIPVIYQVLYVNVFQFFWNIYLSIVANKSSENENQRKDQTQLPDEEQRLLIRV